ncbi:hypothetical protein RA274_28955, partial [Pseudomonas syringae pv. tagetis]
CVTYLSHKSMEFFVRLGVHHLLVDMRSIDKFHDGGLIDNHRCFWGISDPLKPFIVRHHASVTELIEVRAIVPAGHYFMT